MTVERIWILFFLPLPLAWAAWEWRRSGIRAGLILKTLTVLLVLLALAEPVIPTWDTRVAVAVLADTSASQSPEDFERASEIAASIQKARGRNLVQVMPFASAPRKLAPAEFSDGRWRLAQTPGEAGRATNIEASILDALSAMPASAVPRVVLISDGNENRGSAVRAAWQARSLGIPIDVFPLEGRERPELTLESVTFPGNAFVGEQFPIEIRARAPTAVEGTVRVSAEGNQLGATPVRLVAGENHLTVRARLNQQGAFEIAGELETNSLGTVRFAQAVTIRQPRLLYLSQDPPGTETHFVRAIESGGFEIRAESEFSTQALEEFQVVVLNNWNLEAMSEERKEALELFVQRGGGLLVIGGENNVYIDDPLKREDPLERVLPAKLVPPRSPEGTCVVLIIDKSSSMEGRKMELARLSAIGVIDNLRPVDRVGVLIFDNSFQWAVPIRKAENRSLIKRLVAGITPDGGTQIAPALTESYRRALPVQATFKHIVLLTDGISEEGDSIELAQEAAAQKVTISTVGLGQDVNKAYLEKVALLAKGKSYFLTDPSGLAQILLRDVMEHTGQTTVEEAAQPRVLEDVEILASLPPGEFPPLQGYVRYESKPTAETILGIGDEDPLLARWQYGLGRASVFASDAKSRWAEAWVSWPGFDTLWINIVRDLLPHAEAGDARLTYDAANGDLVADYRLASFLDEPAEVPEIFVLGPNGFRQPFPIERVAPGAYRGRLAIGDRRGLFRVRTLEESRLFPETGLYLQEEELGEYGANLGLLENLARFTDGQVEPATEQIFSAGERAVAAKLDLWPWLLLLAVFANVVELVVRKWTGILPKRTKATT